MPNTKCRLAAVALLCAVAHGFGLPAVARAASPNMVRIHTWQGGKHFGPLIDETDDEVAMFDIATATTVNVKTSAIKSKLDKIDELRADSYVPYASYAAWKLGKILRTGRLEATVVHNSEKGVFINCGSEDGIEAGRRCVLLGDPETIVDPTTDEVLGVIREQVGVAIPLTVVSERLSKLDFPEPADENAQKIIDAFAVKRQVEVEQQTKRIVLAPPRWKPTGDAESLDDDANFLHAHLIAELVRYGFTVVSKKQTELMRQQIADERQIEVSEVPDIEIAKDAKADVLVSVDMLAKGITCQVQLQVTNLKTDEYLGIVSGSTRRKDQKAESARAVAFAEGIVAGKRLGGRLNGTIISLFVLAEEVRFRNDGSIEYIHWGGQPMTVEQYRFVCGLKSLNMFTCTCPIFDDSDLKMLTSNANISFLGLWNTRITDKSCTTIANDFPRINAINIGNTKALTETGAKTLALVKELSYLNTFGTNLTDAGLEHLATLPKLNNLIIKNCRITDRGLKKLQGCDSLSRLDIRHTDVTKRGIEEFKDAMPNCDVISSF